MSIIKINRYEQLMKSLNERERTDLDYVIQRINQGYVPNINWLGHELKEVLREIIESEIEWNYKLYKKTKGLDKTSFHFLQRTLRLEAIREFLFEEDDLWEGV